MKDSDKKIYSVISISVLIAGALFVFINLVMPAMDEVKVMRGERDAVVASYADAQNTLSYIKSLKNTYNTIPDARNAVSSFIPSSNNVSDLVSQIYGLSKVAGVNINSIYFKDAPPELPAGNKVQPIPAPYGTVTATMAMNGSYENIKSFVKMLETNIRLIDPVSLTLSGGGSVSPVLDGTLVVNSYYQP